MGRRHGGGEASQMGREAEWVRGCTGTRTRFGRWILAAGMERTGGGQDGGGEEP